MHTHYQTTCRTVLWVTLYIFSETTSNSMSNSNISEDNQRESQKALVERIKVSDRWMVRLTAVLALTSIVSAIIIYFQLWTMHGQLMVASESNKLNLKMFEAS